MKFRYGQFVKVLTPGFYKGCFGWVEETRSCEAENGTVIRAYLVRLEYRELMQYFNEDFLEAF
jgi:hypothetical protein